MATLPVADAPAEGSELRMLGEHQVAIPTPGEGPARVLSLKGRWLKGHVSRRGGCLEFAPAKYFVGGMSGSPIIDATGAAIGVVSCSNSSQTTANPVIVDSLSARLARAIKIASRAAQRGK